MRIFAALSLTVLLAGCVTRQDVELDVWQNDGLTPELCKAQPDLQNYGVYRVVKCTNPGVHGCENGEADYEEFIPYCDEHIKGYLSMKRDDANKWLDKLTRPKP